MGWTCLTRRATVGLLTPAMIRSLAPAAVLCLVALVPCAVLAQQNPPAPQSLPKDPVALMKMASAVNGLHGNDLAPWHLHATWQIFEKRNHLIQQGTFEEWWAAKDSIRVELSSPGFQQTRWVTKQGEFASGDPGWPIWVFRFLYETLQSPLPEDKVIDTTHFRLAHEKLDSQALECSRLRGENQAVLKEYCFSPDVPAIRIRQTRATQTTFDSIVAFQGRYLAADMHVYRLDMPSIEIRIDRLESFSALQGAGFQPAALAVKVAPWIATSGREIAVGSPISRPSRGPDILPTLMLEHENGNVRIAAILGVDGMLHNLEIIGGPRVFQKSAMDICRNLRFKPYMVDGQPTEVQTSVIRDYRYIVVR